MTLFQRGILTNLLKMAFEYDKEKLKFSKLDTLRALSMIGVNLKAVPIWPKVAKLAVQNLCHYLVWENAFSWFSEFSSKISLVWISLRLYKRFSEFIMEKSDLLLGLLRSRCFFRRQDWPTWLCHMTSKIGHKLIWLIVPQWSHLLIWLHLNNCFK